MLPLSFKDRLERVSPNSIVFLSCRLLLNALQFATGFGMAMMKLQTVILVGGLQFQ